MSKCVLNDCKNKHFIHTGEVILMGVIINFSVIYSKRHNREVILIPF